MSTNNGQGKLMDIRIVIPAKAGIHFDFDGRNLDSRFRGNDEYRSALQKCPSSPRKRGPSVVGLIQLCFNIFCPVF